MPEVIVNRDGPVLRISLNRPERRNALNYAIIDQLLDILEPVVDDDECRVVVISGEGTGFCAGDDMGMPSQPFWLRGERGISI